MQDPWHDEAADHPLPPTDYVVGGEITPDYNENDQEAGERQKSQLARTPG